MIKIFHRYFRSRWERFYLKNQWHIALDLSLIMIILILGAAIIFLYIYRPILPVLDGFVKPPVDLNSPPLEISYTLGDRTLDPGEPVQLEVTVKNPGTRNVSNIVLSFEPAVSGYAISNLELAETPDESLSISNKQVLIPVIKAGEELKISLKLAVKRQNMAGRVLKAEAKISYLLNGQEYRASKPLSEIYLTADLVAEAAAYYTSPQGDQLGIGPVPPIVGIPTKYWIVWELKAGAEFRDVTMSAKLPNGIVMTGERSVLSGELSYQADTRLMIWKLPQAQASDGNRVSFEIQLTPSDNQVGEVVTLQEPGRVFGTDLLTGEELSNSFSGLTTALEKDKFNAGHGTVISQ